MDGRVAEVSYFLYVCAWLVMGVDVLIFRMQIVPVTPFALVDRIGIPQQDGLDKPPFPPQVVGLEKERKKFFLTTRWVIYIYIVPFWSAAFLALFGGSSLIASRESSLAPWRRKEISFSVKKKKKKKKRIPRVDIK